MGGLIVPLDVESTVTEPNWVPEPRSSKMGTFSLVDALQIALLTSVFMGVVTSKIA